MRPPSSRFTGRVCVRCARERKGVFLGGAARRVARSLYAQMTRFPAPLRSHSRGEARRAPRVASLSPRRDARDIDEGRVARADPRRALHASLEKNLRRVAEDSSRGFPSHPKRDGNGSLQENSGRPRAFEFAREWYTRQYTADPCASAAESTFRRRGLERALSDGPTRVSFPRAQAHQHAGRELGGELDVPVVVAAGSKAGRGDAGGGARVEGAFRVLAELGLHRERARVRQRLRGDASRPKARVHRRRRRPLVARRAVARAVPLAAATGDAACGSPRVPFPTTSSSDSSESKRVVSPSPSPSPRTDPVSPSSGHAPSGVGTRARRGAPERRRRRSGAAPWRSRRDAGPRRRARTRRARRSRSARPATGASTRCWRVSARPA